MGINGIYLILEDITGERRKKIRAIFHVNTDRFSYKLSCRIITFLLDMKGFWIIVYMPDSKAWVESSRRNIKAEPEKLLRCCARPVMQPFSVSAGFVALCL